jgi:hypothetical protein
LASVLGEVSGRGTTSDWPDHFCRRAGRGKRLNLITSPFPLPFAFPLRLVANVMSRLPKPSLTKARSIKLRLLARPAAAAKSHSWSRWRLGLLGNRRCHRVPLKREALS